MPSKGKKAKKSLLKLIPAGSSISAAASSSSSFLRVRPGSGVVTLAPHAAPAVPKPTQLVSHAPAEPAAAAGRSERRRAAGETTGADWNHMRAPTLTAELKRELLLVKMRGVLDPKRFYRASDSGKGLPKYFQMGTIVGGAEDGREHKLTRKERKGSIAEEMMADSAIRKRAKTQFLKSQARNSEGRKRTVRNKGPAHKKGRAGKRHA